MSLGIPQNANKITRTPMSVRTKESLDAWLKYGTVFLIYRLCTYYFTEYDNMNAELFDAESLQIILFILIGFTIYYMLVKPYVPLNFEHPIFQNVASDTLMFGTVLVTSHILDIYMNNGDAFNADWLKTSGIILLAFAAYEVFINPFVPLTSVSPSSKPVVEDWLKFGSFLVFARLLQGRSVLDQQWILTVLFVLLGFTGYHLVTKRLLNNF